MWLVVNNHKGGATRIIDYVHVHIVENTTCCSLTLSSVTFQDLFKTFDVYTLCTVVCVLIAGIAAKI